VVQAASIDEFYLDLSGTERLFHGEPLEDAARRIRRTLLKESEISVSVGGGTRKLIAKLAAGRAKPGGVLVVEPGREEEFMRGFRLSEIPGVGPVLAKTLESKGLLTVPDLLAVEPAWLERWLGEGRASWLRRRARGLDSSEVNPEEPRKSVSTERTFPFDLGKDEELEKELLWMAGSVGSSLRKAGLRGRTVTVKLRDQDFRTRTASYTLTEAVESDAILYSVARNLLRELRSKRRTGVRLLGVGISSLVEGEVPSQLGLFEEQAPVEPERLRIVSRIMDDLRARFGEDALLPGRMLEGRAGKKGKEGAGE
jgi:DNA polymerase-4